MNFFFDYSHSTPEYIIKTPSASLPITPTDVKVQAVLDVTDTSQDAYLTTIIQSVVSLAESYMKRDIINKTYTAYFDAFPLYDGKGMKLERAILQTLNSIKYYSNGVLVTLDPSNYYTTFSNTYSTIFLNNGSVWPSADLIHQAVQIEFVAGLGADATSIPEDIKQALKQHATFIYQSRGDSADGGFDDRIPDIAKSIYEQYKIYTLTI